MNTDTAKVTISFLLLLAQIGGVAFAAENPQEWTPPKESRNEGSGTAFQVAGGQAYGTFISTASFAEVWSFYARKLGVENPEQMKGSWKTPMNQPEVISMLFGGPTTEPTATLIRRERERQIVISIIGIQPERVRIFVTILPKTSAYSELK